jgi:hypothetical protein
LEWKDQLLVRLIDKLVASVAGSAPAGWGRGPGDESALLGLGSGSPADLCRDLANAGFINTIARHHHMDDRLGQELVQGRFFVPRKGAGGAAEGHGE